MNDQKMRYLFNFALFLCYLIIFFLVVFYSVGKSGAVLDIFESSIIKGLSYMEFMVSAIYGVLLGFNTLPTISEKLQTHLNRKSGDPDDNNMDHVSERNALKSFWKLVKAVYID